MKKLLFTLVFTCLAVGVWSQTATTRLAGRIVSEDAGKSIAGAVVTLANQNISTTTNQNGEFSFSYLQAGDDELLIEADGFNGTVEVVSIRLNETTELGSLSLSTDMQKEAGDEIVLNLSEAELNDDEGRSQEQSSAVSSSTDVFTSNSSWAWSTARYRNRGYASNYETYYIEGLSFNSAERGQFNFSAMGGLNEASRYKETTHAIEANNFSFGGLGNATNYLMLATNYAQGWKVGVGGTNRNYKAVARVAYASGLRQNGWAFAGQLAFRFTPYIDKKGMIGEGIEYYSLGYFFSAEKRWGDRHKLKIITFGSPTTRGQSAAVTQEVYDLTNQYNKTQWGWNNYNPYWGYQNGKMRNSRNVHSFDPTLIVGYDFQIAKDQKLHVALGYHYSLYSNSALSFYNAPDPRPDYYRNLPSFLWDGQINANGNYIDKDANGKIFSDYGRDGFTDGDGTYVGPTVDQNAYNALYDAWTSRDNTTTQINWDAIYAANRANNVNNPNGSARYILERRHNDIQEVMATGLYENTRIPNLKMTAGLELKESIGQHYKTLDDLLDANQWIDIDPFAERDIAELAENIGMTQVEMEVVKQNDVANPYKTIKKGDRFGYDYTINMTTAKLWYQNQWTWRDLDLYYGLQLTYTNMQRVSDMLNGRALYLTMLQPGMEEFYLGLDGFKIVRADGTLNTQKHYYGFRHHFVDPAFKAGLTYKIDGRNHLRFNAIAMTKAPLARDAYLSQRVHDRVVENIYTHDRAKNLKDYYAASEKIVGGDLTYDFNYPIVRGRVTGFYSRFWNQTQLNGYYDDEARTFVNQAMTGLNSRHCGVEAAMSVKLGTYFTLTGTTSVGDYRYTSNASVVTSAENGMALASNAQGPVYELRDSVYMKGVRVSSGPQVNASLKLSFFHPKMWFADITCSYYDWNWLNVAPSRRLMSLYTDTSYDLNGNPVTVNGSYKTIYQPDGTTTTALKMNNGEVVTDKNGKPELIYPYNQLDQQESLVADNVWNRFIFDVSIGKLIYLKNRQSLSIYLSCTNITNNVHFKTGGYQQARLPRSTRQGQTDGQNSVINTNVWKFPAKYYYAWGANFYLTITYKF